MLPAAMHHRTLILERDDPAEPGLLHRRYARILLCWDATLGGWAWARTSAAGPPVEALHGPFGAPELAWEDAEATLGGRWEEGEAGV